jgi:hypothetical protein
MGGALSYAGPVSGPTVLHTQRFNATNIHKNVGSAGFVPKVTLAASCGASLPYIFAELLPVPYNGKILTVLDLVDLDTESPRVYLDCYWHGKL